jgi:predicted RNA methylase
VSDTGLKLLGSTRVKEGEREGNDHYPTPPFVTHALVEELDLRDRRVLEPCAGRGWMAQELERCGCNVTASDLYDYDDELMPVTRPVDALRLDPSGFDAVVTNPPYGEYFAERMLERYVGRCDTVAVLHRIQFMESQKRLDLFRKIGFPTLVMPFSKRFSCDEKTFHVGKLTGGMMTFCWYVWDERTAVNPRSTSMRWIDTQEAYDAWRRAINTAREGTP